MKRSPTTHDQPSGSDALQALLAPVTTLKGVGPKTAAALARRLGTIQARCLDLVLLSPNGKIGIATGDDLAFAVGTSVRVVVEILAHRPARTARLPYIIAAEAGQTGLEIVFFKGHLKGRARWLEERFPVGASLEIMGRLSFFRDRYRMAHPILIGEATESAGVLTDYGSVAGVPRLQFQGHVRQALAQVPDLPEWLDLDLVRQRGWPSWAKAIHGLHELGANGIVEAARQRLAFDELLAFQLDLNESRRAGEGTAAPAIRAPGILCDRLIAALPFQPTADQRRAIGEIAAELSQSRPMRRLLQGDVGTGKTLVAAHAMLQAAEDGHQAVLMAPTELLARQHYRTLSSWIEPLGVEVGLLTGAEPVRQRQSLIQRLAKGEVRLVVGTHALFQDSVRFHDLALVVIDEQHRFGVTQRSRLLAKAPDGLTAHMLATTATPIPRTLLLSLYQDLATSVLRAKPAGRQPIATRLVNAGRIDEVIEACGRALAEGGQIYWVCPLIENADDDVERDAAEARCMQFTDRFGPIVGLAHGRQTAALRDAQLQAFAQGKTRLLVATTVVEVGVDVPSANVMVIESAERFGMAQLHQLRGRVGRGTKPSICLLVYGDALSRIAHRRLRALRETEDGFAISEIDLELRGPGELLGFRQSGLPDFRFVNLQRDAELFPLADRLAKRFLDRSAGKPPSEEIQLLRYLQAALRRGQTTTEEDVGWH